ncbi:uncharacterized protein LOC106091057 [Stomoxys calcitrans]|uniref:Uncharacterized protein n=1 Tax=Stomoxys calcitrans TaxID=35570 RepID=A0A1I8P6X0_STOCA|nr:uncharacterized protein LOC106091057 [Stomoxys calcitrans]
MDYQIVFKLRPVLIIFTLHSALAIVNRDLVLTPKQGLQLSGKRIFYDENAYADATLPSSSNSSNSMNSATGPWERTLKHVTYLTLFTNAANGIITGNFSKVKEYNDFLQSPYIRSPKPIDSRFGDIVTLAQGRLESLPSGLYRFVEGNCDYQCARENNMVATWHVQKIRHRDVDRKFHYEMKFSVSPMTGARPSETVVRGGPNKRTIAESSKPNNIQTFIQKEDDYPHSFSKILSGNQDDDFAYRRQDGLRSIRQYTHEQQQHHSQVTPMPQPAFLRGIYRPPPPAQDSHSPYLVANSPRPFPESLNIGEYYNGAYGPKASPKIELFPNLLTMMFGKPQIYQKPPSTFRPPSAYQQMQFPRPDVYTPQNNNVPPFVHHHKQYTPSINHAAFVHHHEYNKLAEYFPTQQQLTAKDSNNPVITHHYHHHFFTANATDSSERDGVQESSEDQKNLTPITDYVATVEQEKPQITDIHVVTPQKKNEDVHVVTPQPLQFTQVYDDQPHHVQLQEQYQQQIHHNPQYYQQIEHNSHRQQAQQIHKVPLAPQKFIFPIAEIEQHRVVHVTPVPPLRKPQYNPQYYHPLSQHHFTTTIQGPLAIYPANVEEEREGEDLPTPRSHSNPFIQSQPMSEENIRYSEPDPLYAKNNDKVKEEVTYGDEENQNEPQLELPQQYQLPLDQESTPKEDSNKDNSESIEAQVPAPRKTANLEAFDEDIESDHQEEVSTQRDIQLSEQNTSHSTSIKISTENSIETEPTNKATLATTKPKGFSSRAKRVRVKVTRLVASTTTSKPKVFSTRVTTEKDPSTTNTSTSGPNFSSNSKSNKHFVSTSTTETPLKAVSRYRSSNKRLSISTTTTEKPVLKWKPRRKEANAKAINLKNIAHESVDPSNNQNNGDETKAKASIREVKRIKGLPSQSYWSTTESQTEPALEILNADTTTSTTMPSIFDASSQPPSTTSVSEVYEVLTQKSISYKVGEDGPEIPVIFDEAENEVKAQ